MKVRRALVVGGLVVSAILPAACGGQEATRAGESVIPKASRDAFRVGEAVKLGDAELTIHGFKDPFTSDRVKATAAEGSRYVTIDAEVKNLANDPRPVSAFSQFELRDSEGKKFEPSSVNANLPTLGGETPGGGSQRGAVIFEVPNGSTQLTVVFNNLLFRRGTAEVFLG